MIYYVQDNTDKILNISENKQAMINFVSMPQYSDLEVKETTRPIVQDTKGQYVFADTPEYEAQKAQERQEEFNKEFFLTSLGYIRRKVSMSTGETRDFLFDLLPAIKESVSIGQPYPVIVYKQPDFTKEITTEYLVSLQEFKNATEQFCKECTLQIGTDFSGVPMTL